jgi:hypothetical protein
MKKILLAALLLFSVPAFAGGWSNGAVPTKIDVQGDGGFMIYGAFGNAGGCVITNQLYIKSNHSQYKQIYAAALAAFAGQYNVSAYVHVCESIGWYAVPSTTFNIVDAGSTLVISR